MRRPVSTASSRIAGAIALAAALAALPFTAAAQDASPDPTPTPTPTPVPERPAPSWLTGDELRRELQIIRFDFRVDGNSGDWLGWPPRAGSGEAPAFSLDGEGTLPAAATFELPLLGDIGPALTALAEVSTRLPIEERDIAQARRFIIDDLLEASPALLESCYISDWDTGALLVDIDAETALAELRLAPNAARLRSASDGSSDLAGCAPLIPAEVVAILGDPVSERVTLTITGLPAMLEPAEITATGPVVTLILTVANDTGTEQTITFDPPLDVTTGPVEPGGLKLIVIRELEPGVYPFSSDSAMGSIEGSVRIEPPTAD